jgi:hypothetical protein
MRLRRAPEKYIAGAALDRAALEQGPLSLVSTTEELLGRKCGSDLLIECPYVRVSCG